MTGGGKEVGSRQEEVGGRSNRLFVLVVSSAS